VTDTAKASFASAQATITDAASSLRRARVREVESNMKFSPDDLSPAVQMYEKPLCRIRENPALK
jgi:hypothetical protein